MNKFGPAIAELKNALYVVKTNEPINRKEGNVMQAELEKANAESYKAVIDLLKNKNVWKRWVK